MCKRVESSLHSKGTPQRSALETFWKGVMVFCLVLTLFSFWKMYLYFAAFSQTPAYR